MRMCQPHWETLIRGVKDRGMWSLVHQSGEAAMEAEVRSLQGTRQPGDWDPLMAANWAIFGRFMDAVGRSQGPGAALGAMAQDICPLCEIQKSYDLWDQPEQVAKHGPRPANARDAQGWADSCLDAMLDYAREQKLVPVQQ